MYRFVTLGAHVTIPFDIPPSLCSTIGICLGVMP